MAKYIDKDEAIRQLQKYADELVYNDNLYDKGRRIGLNRSIVTVKAVPAADVQPVKRGRWIEHNYWIECNVCGFEVNDVYYEKRDMTSTETRYTYCPRCGARMDKS